MKLNQIKSSRVKLNQAESTHVSKSFPGFPMQLLSSYVYNSRSEPSSASLHLPIHRQAYRSLSKCIAAICESCPAETLPTVQRFIKDVKVKDVSTCRLRALWCTVYIVHTSIYILYTEWVQFRFCQTSIPALPGGDWEGQVSWWDTRPSQLSCL